MCAERPTARCVVHHDAHLPDGRPIVDLQAADLPDYIPDLGAALDACAGMWVNVEIKNDAHDPDFDADRRDRRSDHGRALGAPENDRWLISSFRIGDHQSMQGSGPCDSHCVVGVPRFPTTSSRRWSLVATTPCTRWFATLLPVAHRRLPRCGHRCQHMDVRRRRSAWPSSSTGGSTGSARMFPTLPWQ